MSDQEREEYKPLIFTKIEQVRKWRVSCILENKSVGFVPTMGALHQGHTSLIKQSLSSNDATIISIFVNPSQFAPNEDLGSYPRTVDNDVKLVSELSATYNKRQTKVDAVFVPQVTQIYPSGIPLDVQRQQGAFVSVLGLSEMLEGTTRPNFFRGVATVVSKLFIIVNPTRAYFGQKDYQQALVIKQLVKDLLFDIEVVVCEIYREESGLALSSRNKYLDARAKEVSPSIYKMLTVGKCLFQDEKVYDTASLQRSMAEVLKPFVDEGIMKIDYISVDHKANLNSLKIVDPQEGAVVTCAIYVTNPSNGYITRLIDNILL